MKSMIKWDELYFPCPPTVLHRSAAGIVILKAFYQGLPVSVKVCYCGEVLAWGCILVLCVGGHALRQVDPNDPEK